MNAYEMHVKSLKGEKVLLRAPIIGYHTQTGAPLLGIPQMDDEQWERLAEKMMQIDGNSIEEKGRGGR